MKHDFSVASQFSALLRNEKFMSAMSKIGMSVASLIADDSNRGQVFDAFVKANGNNKKAEEYANGMDYFEANPIAEGVDAYAIAQMIRLLMKENNLDAAIQSGSIRVDELANLGIESGVLTQDSVSALSRMGASNLATVAALNLR